MNKPHEVESAVAHVTGTPRNRVRYVARHLVEAGLWPPSQGRTTRALVPGHALPLIAAIAFAEDRHEVAAVAADFGLLELQANPAGPMAGTAGSTLLETVNGLLAPDCRANVRLKLYRHAGGEAAADVILESERGDVVLPFWRSPSWSGWSRRSWEMAPAGFAILRTLLAREDLADLEFKSA